MYDLYPEKGLFSLGNLLIKDIMLKQLEWMLIQPVKQKCNIC